MFLIHQLYTYRIWKLDIMGLWVNRLTLYCNLVSQSWFRGQPLTLYTVLLLRQYIRDDNSPKKG